MVGVGLVFVGWKGSRAIIEIVDHYREIGEIVTLNNILYYLLTKYKFSNDITVHNFI